MRYADLVSRVMTCVFALGAAANAAPGEPATPANVVREIVFHAAKAHDDPFNQVALDVVFTDPSGTQLKAPAFWAGGDVWKVRYASGRTGVHSYKSVCSDESDAGLNGVEGKVEVEPYVGESPLYRRGPIRVARDRRHFEYADGTPFLWLGDTWWMGLSNRLVWPNEFQALAADRIEKGFNVVQIVAGLYPDQPAFDERSANETGFAWEKDYKQIRPEYFDAADSRIEYLAAHGIVPCIVGAWGYHLPWLGEQKMKLHLRYLMARYGAMPVVWCTAGEFNLPFYLTPGFPNHGQKQAAEWAEQIRYLRSINAFGRPITAHPTGIEPLSARAVLKDASLLDFDMLQTGHGKREVLEPTVRTIRASYAGEPPLPAVNAEVAYEALNGSIPAEIPRLMCWAGYLSGAAGHTYGANGIWQLNRKEKAYGNSPWGGNYGSIPWDEAMHLPGSAQVGIAKKLLSSLPFASMGPHPEWASFEKPDANAYLVPYCLAAEKQARVIYAPLPQSVVVKNLEAGVTYGERLFDPVTGESTAGKAVGGGPGSVVIAPPTGCDHDWVVILDARGR